MKTLSKKIFDRLSGTDDGGCYGCTGICQNRRGV